MKQARYWILLLAAGGLLLLVLRLTFAPVEPQVPEDAPRKVALLPWNIETDSAGGSTVFATQFGVTPFAVLETLLGGDAVLSLFVQADGTLALEAFLDNRVMAGLKADFIAVLEVDAASLQAMYDRGLRIARGRDATRRVTLHPDDAHAARALAITTLTYLPAIDLEAALLERRFGTPAERIPATDGRAHWLYPEMGLDILVSEEEREVLQYVAPRDFERLRAPLNRP